MRGRRMTDADRIAELEAALRLITEATDYVPNPYAQKANRIARAALKEIGNG